LPVNNHVRTFDLRVQGIYANKNRLLGRMVILHDATDRRQAEERFRRLLEATPDAMLVVDEHSMIQTVNKRAFTVFGYTKDEMLGMDVHRVISPRSITYPETARIFNQSLSTGEPYEGLRLIAIHKDGHEFSFESSLSPLETPDGRLLIINARDISDRQATEEQLRLQSVALSSAGNGILIADRNGRIVWVNPAFSKMTGYALQEAVGRMSNLLRSGVHDQAYYEKLWSTILSGQVWQGEMINRRKDGSTYIEEQTIAPVVDTYGNVTHFVAIKNDISERKQLEQMRDNLLHTLVHDLRNPLNNIISSLNIAMFEATPVANPEAHDSFMTVAQISAQRMETLVSSILDLTKLESGSMPLNRERINLEQVVESVLLMQATLANTKNLELQNLVSPEMPPAWADPALIGRVLQNLIDNAIKFGPDGSHIEIGAALDERKQNVVVSVHDHGVGIPPELRSRLFQKFAAGSRGTGIGLAFCRLAIEAHGGKIWVESETDEGTTFYFSLPISRTGPLPSEIAVSL
jgi:PAS domain S-box-containing protein